MSLLLLSNFNENWNGFAPPVTRRFQRFRVVSHMWTDGRTDGSGECDVRSAGMRKRLKENEEGVDAEEHRQGIQTQIKGHVCGGNFKVESCGYWNGEKPVRGLDGEAVTTTSCF